MTSWHLMSRHGPWQGLSVMTKDNQARRCRTVSQIPDPTSTPWVTVPEGGRMLAGLSRSASYAAAARGELPTVRIGRRLVVPVARLREILGLDGSRAAG